MSVIKVIIFDFDGVIVDSNTIKRNAFLQLFPKEDRHVQKIIHELVDFEPESSRYEKLQKTFTRMGKPAGEIPKLVEEYSRKYNTIIQKEITESGLMRGVKKTLSELCQNYSLYINTGTPRESIEQTIDTLGISHFFKGVYARPENKEENIHNILMKENALPKQAVVVGDGPSDLQSAQVTGCRFIGLRNDFNGWKDENFVTISGLDELPYIIDELKK